MLLRELAQSARTPQALLDQLISRVVATKPARNAPRDELSTYLTQARWLAANPNTPAARVVDLIDGIALGDNGGKFVVQLALTRPGITSGEVITILEATRSRTLVALALEHVIDPDTTLVAYALEHGDGTKMWEGVLRHPAATHAQRWDATTRFLTSMSPVSQAARGLLKRELKLRLAAATTRAAHTSLREQLLTWRRPQPNPADTGMAATLDRHLNDMLDALPTQWVPPVRGTTGWLANPDTTEADVTTWADQGGAKAWRAVLSTRLDPRRELVTHALKSYPTDQVLLGQVVRNETYPLPIRQVAAVPLAKSGRMPEISHTGALLRGGDPDLAVELFIALGASRFLDSLFENPNLTSTHLERVMSVLNDTAPFRSQDTRACWFATHPAATSTQRARARKMLNNVPPSFRSALAHWVLAETTTLDGNDPASVAAVGARLTSAALSSRQQFDPVLPGVPWLLDAALDAAMDTAPGADFATVLLSLEVDFTGTIAELATTTRAILA